MSAGHDGGCHYEDRWEKLIKAVAHLEGMPQLLNEIKAQVMKTNGRVTRLEWAWVFALGAVTALGLVFGSKFAMMSALLKAATTAAGVVP